MSPVKPFILVILVALVTDAYAAPDKGAPVTVAAVKSQLIYRQVHLTGTVTSQRSAKLSAAVSGLVQALHVDAGSRVKTGDLLLELDQELALLQWQSSQARVKQASTALADAKRRLSEARELAPQRSIAESAVRDLEAEVAQDTAALQEAQAQERYQQAVLARHQVKAPFAGVVSAKLTELGQWVTPEQAVLELVAIRELRLDFPVAEDYLSAINGESRVSFALNADPQQSYHGHVATVVPVTDPGARTFLLQVLPSEPIPSLLPGMSVRATLRLPTGRNGLVVPRDATLRYPDGRTIVWTVEEAGDGTVVAENPVQTGLSFDGLVEVLRGLASGARVVVQGNEALQAGQRVWVKPSEALVSD